VLKLIKKYVATRKLLQRNLCTATSEGHDGEEKFNLPLTLVKGNGFELTYNAQRQWLGLASENAQLLTEDDVLQELGLANAQSNSELQKYLPENFVTKLEKTFLGKRGKVTADHGSSKRVKTAL
jgi:hypothetical protein